MNETLLATMDADHTTVHDCSIHFHDDCPFRATSRTIAGMAVVFVGAALANAAGLGGGALFVPLFNVLIGFGLKQSTALSQAVITAGALTSMVFNLFRCHPEDPTRPIIDVRLALMLTPVTLLGVGIGVLFNVIFPVWLLTVLLTAMFCGLAVSPTKRGLAMWRKETAAARDAAASRAAANGGYANGGCEPEWEPDGMSAEVHLGEKARTEEGLVRNGLASSRVAFPSASSSAEEGSWVTPGQTSVRTDGHLTTLTVHADGAVAGDTAPSADGRAAVLLATARSNAENAYRPAASRPSSSMDASPSSGVGKTLRRGLSRSPSSNRSLSGSLSRSLSGAIDLPDLITTEHMQPWLHGSAAEAPALASTNWQQWSGRSLGFAALDPDAVDKHVLGEPAGRRFQPLETEVPQDSHDGSRHRRPKLPLLELAEMGALWVVMAGLQSGKARLQRCGGGYWALWLLQIGLCLSATGFFIHQAVCWAAAQQQMVGCPGGEEADSERQTLVRSPPHPEVQKAADDGAAQAGIEMTYRSLVRTSLVTLAAGALAGLMGIGGGMVLGPLMLGIGIDPQVTAATSSVMVLFSSSGAVFNFAVIGRLNLQYAAVFAAISTVAALCGVSVVARLVRMTGRPSIIVLILSSIIWAGAILAGVFGGLDIVEDLRSGGDLGWHSLCASG